MGKRRQSKKVYGENTHYWRKEITPLLLAAACVDIAVNHSNDARAIYQQIIDAWDRPDCQALLKDNIALPFEEIRALTRKMKGYAGQERRLMNALRLEVATPDIVLDEINQMKKEREADQKRLDSLTQTKANIDKMIDMESNLKELCARIVPDLNNCTNQDKKDAYTYLDLKVKATPEGADIKGYLVSSVISPDSCLLTTGQTSA